MATLAVRIIASTEIARAVCLGDFFRAPEHAKTKILWDSKIHDAGVSFFTTDQALDTGSARNLVKAAKSENAPLAGAAASARSFAFGKCPADNSADKKESDAKSWLALFSAPKPAVVTQKDFRLPTSSVCKEHLVRWISASQGPSISLAPGPHRKYKIPEGDGLVSVTCSHDSKGAQPAESGPELWFSIPTGKGPSAKTPGDPVNGRAEDFTMHLLQWINQVRDLEKLKPVEKMDLPGMPDLTGNQSPLHDRKLLQQISVQARTARNYLFRGENRVVARNIEDAAWLLWNSPRHRDLLLSKDSSMSLVQSRRDAGSDLITTSILMFSSSANDKR